MLSVNTLYSGDLADGSLEQMLRAPASAVAVALAKAAAHWLVAGLPLIVAAPVIGLLFDMSGPALTTLVVGLLLGTPILSLLGGLGAALTLGLRSGGMLLILIVLPLATPALIFGAGAVDAVESGLSASGHHSLLAALLIATLAGTPVATAAALRISTE
jgi:heme exporter protein B